VTKVPVPQNWNFFKKRVGAVLLKGSDSCNSKREFPVVTLRPPFQNTESVLFDVTRYTK